MDALDISGVFSPDRQAFHRARYRFASSYIAGQMIADIACGLGYGCRIMKENGAKTILGMDICVEAVEYAQSIHGSAGVRFVAADATKIPLSASSVDTVTSFETIEHVSNTVGLLNECRRILKPKGTIIVSSPNDWGLTEHHCHTWTPFEFIAEIAVYFDIESVWEHNSEHFASEYHYPPGIRPWNSESSNKPECIIIVARNAESKQEHETASRL